MQVTVKSATGSGDADALRDIVRQSEISGAARRAVLLHVDRLPHALSRPHHVRLARQALSSLARADRAQTFDLPQGRVGIVWRGGDGELAQAHEALSNLLSGQPASETPALGELLTVYELPQHAAWLLDDIANEKGKGHEPPGREKLDLELLARLEASLARADLSRFARWRQVMHLPARPGPARDSAVKAVLAWEERYFAVYEIAASLCPERHLRGDPWLFRRLTRTLDTRLLAMLTAPGELRSVTPLAINLNVASLLSPGFVQFDNALPLALRGQVIINLRAADILSDAASFAFARNFIRSRGYRLALAGATPAVLRFLDVAAAGLDFVHLAYDPALREHAALGDDVVDGRVPVVLTGLERPSDVRWAVENGFFLGRGRVFSL